MISQPEQRKVPDAGARRLGPAAPSDDHHGFMMIMSLTVNYVLEEKGLKKDNDEGVKMSRYEEYVKQRKIFIYNTVKVEDDDVIKYEYNVLQEDQKIFNNNNFYIIII